MDKTFQWAVTVMLFIIMIAVAGPQVARWYEAYQHRGETSPSEIQVLEKDSSPEAVRTMLMGKCQDSGSTSSPACRQYGDYTAIHPYGDK